jgi:hypothetical protein
MTIAASDEKPRRVRSIRPTGARRVLASVLASSAVLLGGALPASAQSATITWGTTHQTIAGFGAANADIGQAANSEDVFFFSTLGYQPRAGPSRGPGPRFSRTLNSRTGLGLLGAHLVPSPPFEHAPRLLLVGLPTPASLRSACPSQACARPAVARVAPRLAGLRACGRGGVLAGLLASLVYLGLPT